MIYKCKRTATIVSRNYNTMARISYPKFREVALNYPFYQILLKRQVFDYKDDKLMYLRSQIRKIPFFKTNLPKKILHDMIFGMEAKMYEKGQIILKELDSINSLCFLQKGMIEVYTEFEGNDFILDRLYQGSCINHRSFFIEDLMYISMRALENCIILQLDRKVFNDIVKEHEEFSNKVGLYQNALFSRLQKFPLDYIVELPDIRRDRRVSKKKM